ncbi:MAG: hypothetical protein ABII82_19840 [Verrucomicrobiota bacterium]
MLKTASLPLIAAVALIASQPLAAADITVINGDFETGGFLSDGFSNNPGGIPTGWSAIGAFNGAFFGYLNPDNGHYTGTTGGSSTVAGMNGANLFYFGTATTGQGIQQTLSAVLQEGFSYDLTVALGARKGGETFTASLDMRILAGSTVIAQQVVHNDTADSFADFTLSYVYNPADSALLGQDIIIQLLEEDGVQAGEVDIDNVRFTAAMPEPAAAGLVAGLFALGLFAGIRRRRI